MSKLWKKSSSDVLHTAIEAYTVGDDIVLDMELLPFDILASKAHANMLAKIKILTEEENTALQKALDNLLIKYENDEVEIKPEDEDCHTVIENFLVEQCGDAGKKIHTGRSRNDQVLVAFRLLLKARLQEVQDEVFTLAELFGEKSNEWKNIPLPGYTHTQQAMLSSLGHYCNAFMEALDDDGDFCGRVLDHIDQNPLGSAAGYGVAIPLDREMTTEELGFASVQKNSLYCQLSRGKFESLALEALSQIMLTLGKFANDMIWYTSQEFSFFTADNSVVTGSSIMPQKRNLDGLEILRGNVSVVLAHQIAVKDISKNLFSGYHRDLQLLKKPVLESFFIVLNSLEIASIYLQNLTPNEESITKKITKEMFLADIANELVQNENMPFREAYQKAYDHLDTYKVDLQKNIASKVSLGSPGNF